VPRWWWWWWLVFYHHDHHYHHHSVSTRGQADGGVVTEVLSLNVLHYWILFKVIKFGFTVIWAAKRFRFVSGTAPFFTQSFYERLPSRELFPIDFIMSVR
jgi:hypothetical protein